VWWDSSQVLGRARHGNIQQDALKRIRDGCGDWPSPPHGCSTKVPFDLLCISLDGIQCTGQGGVARELLPRVCPHARLIIRAWHAVQCDRLYPRAFGVIRSMFCNPTCVRWLIVGGISQHIHFDDISHRAAWTGGSPRNYPQVQVAQCAASELCAGSMAESCLGRSRRGSRARRACERGARMLAIVFLGWVARRRGLRGVARHHNAVHTGERGSARHLCCNGHRESELVPRCHCQNWITFPSRITAYVPVGFKGKRSTPLVVVLPVVVACSRTSMNRIPQCQPTTAAWKGSSSGTGSACTLSPRIALAAHAH
jgi:hypothetical protein